MNRRTRILARDIMQKQVLKLDADLPIERAIQTFEENEISGAPVVDSSSRLVGILTKSDLTRSEHVRSGRIETTMGAWSMSEPSVEGAENGGDEDLILGMEDYSPAVHGADTVLDWMHPGAVTVEPTAALQQVCRLMIQHRIHRVVVVHGKAVEGIITSFDVVRWVAEGGRPMVEPRARRARSSRTSCGARAARGAEGGPP